MSYTENRGTMKVIRSAVTNAGATWPAPLQAALDEADRLADHAPAGTPEQVATAYAAAILAGRNPATDKATQAALAAWSLGQTVTGGRLLAIAARMRADALAEHAPGIIADLRAVVADADRTLVECRVTMPRLDVREPEQISSSTPAEAAAWATARAAAARVEQAAGAWSALAQAAGRSAIDARRRALLIADLDWQELDALGHQPATLAPLHAGHRLALATFAEYDERVARVVAEPARLAAEATEDRRALLGIRA